MLGDAAIINAVDRLGFKVIDLMLKQHACPTPSKEAIETLDLWMGTRIECKTCGREHVLKNNQRDGWYWERVLKDGKF